MSRALRLIFYHLGRVRSDAVDRLAALAPGMGVVIVLTMAAVYFLPVTERTLLLDWIRVLVIFIIDNRTFLTIALVVLAVGYVFARVIGGLLLEASFGGIKVKFDSRLVEDGSMQPVSDTTDSKVVADSAEPVVEYSNQIKHRYVPIDASDPENIFKISRIRLLDEAVRLSATSGRNLTIGILFSAVALGVLALPLFTLAFEARAERLDVITWAAQYYLPRFAVGLLLQFVGFFFLRLYVANELDLKHNKNELTNLELKMMGVLLAKTFGDSASKKEIMKSLAGTERNFIIKKNEKSVSMEALTEYNDLKGMFEKLIAKIPGSK